MSPTNRKRTTTITTTEAGASSSSSGARARARTREAEISVQLASIRETYSDAIGTPMNEILIREAEKMLLQGVPYEYFSYALQEAAFAPRPSWRYAMAIIRRLEIQQISAEEVRQMLWLRS